MQSKTIYLTAENALPPDRLPENFALEIKLPGYNLDNLVLLSETLQDQPISHLTLSADDLDQSPEAFYENRQKIEDFILSLRGVHSITIQGKALRKKNWVYSLKADTFSQAVATRNQLFTGNFDPEQPITLNLDVCSRDDLTLLQYKLRNKRIKELTLFSILNGQIWSDGNCGQHSVLLSSTCKVCVKNTYLYIKNFINELRGVQLFVLSDYAFNDAKRYYDRIIIDELCLFATQTAARNRFLALFNATECVDPWRTIIQKWFSLNPSPKHTLHYLTPGENAYILESNRCIVEMGDLFLQHLLANFPCRTRQWVINYRPTESQLKLLTKYIQQTPVLPFERLSLYVSNYPYTTGFNLDSHQFKAFLQALSHTSLRGLTLVFPEDELAIGVEHTASLLQKIVVPYVNFPVAVSVQTPNLSEKPYQGKAFHKFETALITQMQSVNSAKMDRALEKPKHHPSLFTAPKSFGGKKIALKQLLGKGKIPPKEIKQLFERSHMKTHVQHVAVHQQQQAVVQTVTQQVQAQNVHQIANRIQQTQEITCGVYEGKLINYAEFCSEKYRKIALANGHRPEQIEALYRVIQQEFFANMPHAIKYFSEEAACELAEKLANFCALNVYNLPEDSPFVLHKTPQGEIVLDVNKHSHQKKINPFTPKAYEMPAQQSLMYLVTLNKHDVKNWIQNDTLFLASCYQNRLYNPEKLVNLWAKFGDRGVRRLFDALQELDKKHNGLSEFLIIHYLNYFPDWEIFLLPETQFFENLERLGKYNATQLTCLKKFMINSGCSQHHLTHTLDAFDAFWENTAALCEEKSVDIAQINSDWSTGSGYIPLFLANDEQIKQLKPGEFGITSAKWGSNWDDPKALLCYVRDQRDNLTEFTITQQELETTCADQKAARGNQNPVYHRLFRLSQEELQADDLELIWPDILAIAAKKKYIHCVSGNPVVYMERLWTILSNARDLSEQMIALNGVTLDNYGAHCASRFEQFKVVSSAMGLCYKPTQQNAQLFSPSMNCHRVGFESMMAKIFCDDDDVEDSNIYCDNLALFSAHACRIVGQVEQGIFINRYISELQNYSSGLMKFNYSFEVPQLAIALFFLIHNRYQGKISLNTLLKNDAIARLNTHRIIYDLEKQLMRFFALNIHFSEEEGLAFVRRIGEMNSFKFEIAYGKNDNKNNYIQKLFLHLEKNKYGAFKLLSQARSQWFIHALDIVDYWNQHYPVLDTHYREDLLLFALLTGIHYWEKNKKDQTKELEKINSIAELLVLAATTSYPNNYHYAFKLIVNAAHSFTVQNFIAAFNEIKKLTQFDPEAINQILLDHKFHLTAFHNQTWSGKQFYLKDTLIHLIFSLNHFMATGNLALSSPSNVSEKEWQALIRQEEEINATETLINEKLYSLEAQQSVNLQKTDLGNEIVTLLYSKADLNLQRQTLEEKAKAYAEWQAECTKLRALNVKELNQIFFDLWNNQNLSKVIEHSPLILDQIKLAFLVDALSIIGDSKFAQRLQMNLVALSDFNAVDDFDKDKLERLFEHAKKLGSSFKAWLATDSFNAYKKDLIDIFNSIDFKKWNYDALLNTVTLITKWNDQDYRNILKQLLNWHDNLDTNLYLFQLNKIQWLCEAGVSTQIIHNWMPFISNNIDNDRLDGILKWVICASQLDDPLLALISNKLDLAIENVEILIAITQDLSPKEKMAVTGLLEAILAKNSLVTVQSFLQALSKTKFAPDILKLIAYCQAIPEKEKTSIDYIALAQQLANLSTEDFAIINKFCVESSLSIAKLLHLTKAFSPDRSLEESLAFYEKAPFGPRDLEKQFDISQLERIVNGVTDPKNQTRRTYQHRKQLMEAALYVNALGSSLPAYQGKPAKDLSNEEIKDLFLQLKQNSMDFSGSLFAKQLYALGLLREAFYRQTDEFAYCSQLAAIIDCMLQPVGTHTLNQIDTGQGKTLSDSLKAVLLWLDREGGEVATSSRADAKRDHSLFFSTLTWLGIPVSDQPITQASDFQAFKADGINYTTVSDLSLLNHHADVAGITLRSKDAPTFMILSEADRATLDDRTIFRYAELDPDGVGSENEWLYYAINDFVRLPKFKADNTAEQEDIAYLRHYLATYSNEYTKPPHIVQQLTDERLLAWIESAIVLKRLLHKDIQYVIKPGQKTVQGRLQPVYEIKIIQEIDNKIDEEAVFDKTIQPLLCAYLNSKLQPNDPLRFVIDSETKTILASNSKNLLMQYAQENSVIWGSTATIGSLEEIVEQFQTYGFSFSTIPPYQESQLDKDHPPVIKANQNEQYQAILAAIQKSQAEGQQTAIVAWHDIPKANAFYEFLKTHFPEKTLQRYSDQNTEEELIIIRNAPDKITSATRGLGRNTNVPYDRNQGMLVIQTEPDTLRNTNQLAGRTGREGSKGTFLRIFNKADFPDETVEQAISRLEERSKQRREAETPLFDLLGYLLEHTRLQIDDEKTRAIFFKKIWAKFSEDTENNYRRIHAEETYSSEKFISWAVEQFNSTVNMEKYPNLQIKPDEVITALAKKHSLAPTYHTYATDVSLSDCIPTPVIAYHYLQKIGDASHIPQVNEQQIRDNLQALFTTLQTASANAVQAFADHLSPLLSHPPSLATVRRIAEEQLTDFLQTEVQYNQNLNRFQRWILGMRSHLDTITDNRNYLILLTALIGSPTGESNINIETIKNTVTTLLNNYLTNHWFISQYKVEAIEQLLELVQNSQNLNAIIDVLAQGKDEVLKKDIVKNQDTFWSSPVNTLGSRFQSTLDNALLLLTSLQSNQQDRVITESLQQLRNITTPAQQNQLDRSIATKDFDEIKNILPTLSFIDQNNANVIKNSLENWLDYKLLHNSLSKP